MKSKLQTKKENPLTKVGIFGSQIFYNLTKTCIIEVRLLQYFFKGNAIIEK